MLTKKQFNALKRDIELGKPVRLPWDLGWLMRDGQVRSWKEMYHYERTDENDWWHNEKLRKKFYIGVAIRLGLINPHNFRLTRLYYQRVALKLLTIY